MLHEHTSNFRGKLHLTVDTYGMPVRIIVTQDTTADCKLASQLIEGIDADYLIANRGYDTDAILEKAAGQNMDAVIPPKQNRKVQRAYDKHLYRLRHLVENAFEKLERWRGIATRYAKNDTTFLDAVQIRCLVL